jgi:hypothetical protein
MALGWRREYVRYRDLFLNIVYLYRKRQDLKIYLEILLSLAAVSVFVTFALRPTVLTISELYREIKTKEETIVKLDQKITNLGLAQTNFDQEVLGVTMAKTSVPGTPTPESYVRQIEGLAIQNGLSLLGASVGEVTLVGTPKPGAVQELDRTPLPEGANGIVFSMSMSGDYQQLYSFIVGLESLRRPIKIDSVGISSSQTEEGTTRLVLMVNGRVPYLK